MMVIWLDAQLPPSLAAWISKELGLDCHAVRDLGLRDAADMEIFQQASKAKAIVMTKDKDFVELLYQHGPPPFVIWLTCGNTSNESLKIICADRLMAAIKMIELGDELVEIN